MVKQLSRHLPRKARLLQTFQGANSQFSTFDSNQLTSDVQSSLIAASRLSVTLRWTERAETELWVRTHLCSLFGTDDAIGQMFSEPNEPSGNIQKLLDRLAKQSRLGNLERPPFNPYKAVGALSA